MGALLFIFCLALGFGAGYAYRSVFGGRKKAGINSYIQAGEILLDAGSNKEISGITSSYDGSQKNKLLNKLTKMVNDAAQNGQTHLNLYGEYDLNKKINKYLTKKELKNYFGSRGYHVEFKYHCLDDSDIRRISWE